MKDSGQLFKVIAVFLFAAAATAFGFFSIRHLSVQVDEFVHCRQIVYILTGKMWLPDICPYLPGYHWTMALISRLTGAASVNAFRIFNGILSFGCIASFYFLARKVDRDSAASKTMLFAVFPLSYPFFCLVYTDMYAMLYVLLGVLCALHKRFWLSGIAFCLSLVVRQNNIIWAAFTALLICLENGFSLRPSNWGKLRRPLLFFAAAAILFGVFVVWNQGVVFRDRANHFLTLSPGNALHLLFLFFFLFLPHNLANAPKILRLIKEKFWPALAILGAVFLVYAFIFKADHPYNQADFFLHHHILRLMELPLPFKILTFLPIAYSVLSLCVTPLRHPSFYWLYPLTLVFLLPMPVIEIRYLFIPLLLFLAFKEADGNKTFVMTLLIYCSLSWAIIRMVADRSYFP